MADLEGVSDAFSARFLPVRLWLDEQLFKQAFDAYAARETAADRKATIDGLGTTADIDGRVLRKARRGQCTLPRHQVLKLAELLGCSALKLVRDPDADRRLAERAALEGELRAWPVPLLAVTSWSDFVPRLRSADEVRLHWGDDVLELAAAPEIDRFAKILDYARAVVAEAPATAGAALRDAAQDLAAHDLNVLAGRFVGRRQAWNSEVAVELVYVLVLRISRTETEPLHAVDRSGEPLTTSDTEDFNVDDIDATEGWLEWEGKRRLALWPPAAPSCLPPGAGAG